MGAWGNSAFMGEFLKENYSIDFYIGGTNYNNNYKSAGSKTNYSSPITIIVSSKGLKVINSDESIGYNSSFNTGSWNCGINMFLFARNHNGSRDNGNGIFKVYSCKIYNNNELVRDLIPVKRKQDNVVCMYDKISNTFFTNAGSGTFTAGPEI